jgi:hypothetical protein
MGKYHPPAPRLQGTSKFPHSGIAGILMRPRRLIPGVPFWIADVLVRRKQGRWRYASSRCKAPDLR